MRRITSKSPRTLQHNQSSRDPKKDSRNDVREIHKKTYRHKSDLRKSSPQETIKKGNESGYQPFVSFPSSFQMLNMLVKLVVDLRASDE